MDVKDYLELYNIPRCDITDDQLNAIKSYNKDLIDRYPFLKPYKVYTGEDIEGYDYSYTWLDDMEDGWRIAFGMDMVEELRNELLKFPYDPKDNYDKPAVCENDTWLNHYKITQVKEKFGELRWYDAGIPGGHSRVFIDIINEGSSVHVGEDGSEPCKVWDIVNKYTNMSRSICFKCGKPAKYLSTGWICPWCEDCANEYVERENKHREAKGIDYKFSLEEDFRPINEE